MDREAWWTTVHEAAKSQTRQQQHTAYIYIHVKLNHFAISETEKILQTNYTSINKFKNYKQKTPQAIR